MRKMQLYPFPSLKELKNHQAEKGHMVTYVENTR